MRGRTCPAGVLVLIQHDFHRLGQGTQRGILRRDDLLLVLVVRPAGLGQALFPEGIEHTQHLVGQRQVALAQKRHEHGVAFGDWQALQVPIRAAAGQQGQAFLPVRVQAANVPGRDTQAVEIAQFVQGRGDSGRVTGRGRLHQPAVPRHLPPRFGQQQRIELLADFVRKQGRQAPVGFRGGQVADAPD